MEAVPQLSLDLGLQGPSDPEQKGGGASDSRPKRPVSPVSPALPLRENRPWRAPGPAPESSFSF